MPITLAEVLAGIVEREKGLVDHPHDPGGLTNWGISQRAYPDEDIRGMTRERAATLYERDYYRRPGFDRLPLAYVDSVLDLSVHAGPRQAVQVLQRAVGVPADGQLGPQTFAALSTLEPCVFARQFAHQRLLTYARMVQRNPRLLSFLAGWVNRAFAPLTAACTPTR